jgi:hypothetical protein
MISEPTRSGSGRNNNLLGLAIVLFMIGLPILQFFIFLAPIFAMFIPMNPIIWIVILLLGVIPTIGGVYAMYKWYYSGH